MAREVKISPLRPPSSAEETEALAAFPHSVRVTRELKSSVRTNRVVSR